MSRVLQEPAFVLHRRAYRETSTLVEAFTLNRGRVGLVHRGAKRSGRRPDQVQPFRLLRLSWLGRGELYTLMQAEVAAVYPLGDARRALCGLYLNELTLRLMPRGLPSPQLYECYAQTLEALDRKRDLETALRRYEFELLVALGYGLHLEQDAEGAPVCATGSYRYDQERGLVRCRDADRCAESIAGSAIDSMRTWRLNSAEVRRQVRCLLRSALDHHLQGRELHTRRLMGYVYK